MTEFIRVTIEGTPVAKARPRFTRNGVPYTASATAAYEKRVAEEAALAMLLLRLKPTTAPVRVDIALVFPIPPTWPKARRAAALIGRILPMSADIDNVCKSLLDGCNDVVFKDDSQVVELHATKSYGLKAMAVVRVAEIIPQIAVEVAS